MKFIENRRRFKGAAMLKLAALLAFPAFAAEAPKPSELNNPLAITLAVVMVGLLLAIGTLAYVVIGAGRVYLDRIKEQTQKQTASVASKVVAIFTALLLSTTVFAADEPVKEQAVKTISGLSKSSFYAMVSIIGLELLILVVLALLLKRLIAKEKAVAIVEESLVAKPAVWKKWWEKANSFKPAHEEEAMVLEHNYDGIRELDNRLPPWWLYSFYACVIFAFVYIYRFHISHSAASSIQEYEVAMAKAELEKEEYLKKAANKVDENTVTMLTDATALAEGKKIFRSSCAACHGPEGQGVVGPNLTDDYWLYKGSVKDVFKTIKYGVPEKGMKSWKDDFSPVQIAQLASYIKSLKGTKPANAKEPQGELLSETPSASTADSTKLAVKF